VLVLDYGSGNLRSAERALARAGAAVTVSADRRAALAADGLVVPGVGAFAACMAGLDSVGGAQVIRARVAAGRPVLGVCVGMQVLFTRGSEHGDDVAGCAEWPGLVERLRAPVLPHMGWNTVGASPGSRLLRGVAGERFYFVHSYGVRVWEPAGRSGPDPAVSWTAYGPERFVAAVEDGALAATQFHPEKSGEAGAHLLANWVEDLRG
jgi:imidazole glycerol-phosphate synthase subunit HisH